MIRAWGKTDAVIGTLKVEIASPVGEGSTVGKHKEGFRLFTLLDRTKSKVRKQCLREWMLKPLLDTDAIQDRQDGVQLFLRPLC